MPSTGGLYITGNTTPFEAEAAAALFTEGWTAFARGNDGTITEVAASSKLTLRPGLYLVMLTMAVETEYDSSTDAGTTGQVTFGIRKDAVQVAGLKTVLNAAAVEEPYAVAISGIVKVGNTDTGDLTVYVESSDANGTDIVVNEGQLVAMLID